MRFRPLTSEECAARANRHFRVARERYEALQAALLAAIPEARLTTQRGGAELVLHTPREGLLALMLTLRDTPGLEFAQCMDICGVDWPERPERFEVVYNLLSLSLNQRLRVVVPANESTPVPSVAAIWPAATWFERETWDMYGVVFEGLSDMRRLLTDYGFEGHPLRKDYPKQKEQPLVPYLPPQSALVR
jgi:NADH-quinone oxidoreductase subunit C